MKKLLLIVVLLGLAVLGYNYVKKMLLIPPQDESTQSDNAKYFAVPIEKMAAGNNFHTHVIVKGRVVYVKHEDDGDTHIRLVANGAFIIAECIPKLPCTPPRVGQVVTVKGISRFDGEHKWYEVHPVEEIQ